MLQDPDEWGIILETTIMGCLFTVHLISMYSIKLCCIFNLTININNNYNIEHVGMYTKRGMFPVDFHWIACEKMANQGFNKHNIWAICCFGVDASAKSINANVNLSHDEYSGQFLFVLYCILYTRTYIFPKAAYNVKLRDRKPG